MYLTSVATLCVDSITSSELTRIKKDLTYNYQPYGEVKGRKVTAYELVEENGENYLHIPRDYGVSRFGIDQFSDETSKGTDIDSPLGDLKLWDHQVPIVDDALSLFEGGEYDVVVEAGTGYGKTVMGIKIAAELGVKTLVIVDQDNLIKQWREDTAHKLYGLPMEKIGHVQGENRHYEGCTVTVATVQTLVKDSMPEEFYDEFGLVIWDEGHTTAAAEGFSKTLWWFNARYRLMVSATPDRTDAFGEILRDHLGEPKVTTDHKHRESGVKYVNYGGVCSSYAMSARKKGRLVSELVEDGKRNLLIAKATKYMFDEGRDVLVLSDRVAHLHELKSMLIYMGVPSEKVGMNTGDNYYWCFAKDDSPPRRPVGWLKGTEYTPVKLIYKKKKATVQQKEQVKLECSIILATFGVFKKGVDVPRLSGGIDATPQAVAKQAHGRILRETPDYPDKPVPLWITIRDYRIGKCEGWFLSRVNDYTKSNAEVTKWKQKDNEDVQQLRSRVGRNIRSLKGKSVLTRRDGSYTLQT